MASSYRWFFPVTLLLSVILSAQQKAPVPQTARQALLEMISGDETAVMKHLTVEMQQMIADQMKAELSKSEPTGGKATTKTPSPAAADKTSSTHETRTTVRSGGGMIGLRLPGMMQFPHLAGSDFKSFDSGPVLFTYGDQSRQRIEVRIESDDLSGEEDHIQLSFHVMNDGQEQDIPYMPSVTVGMKQQEKIWRLNKVSASVDLAVGDPKFFESLANLDKADTHVHSDAVASNPEVPLQSASETVSMLAFSETMYARQHPEVGFTCSLAELFADKMVNRTQAMDPKVATGAYNGYRFSLSGCNGNPAETFHIVAEPVTPGNGAKAYCTDTTGNLRVSESGVGAACLASGTVSKRF
jgi:hypothetical protein